MFEGCVASIGVDNTVSLFSSSCFNKQMHGQQGRNEGNVYWDLFMQFVDDPDFGVKRAVQLFSRNSFAAKAGTKDYLEVFFRFVDDPDFGVKRAVQLFSNDVFAAQIDEDAFMETFLQFLDEYGITDSVTLFKDVCFAKRVMEPDFMRLFIQFVGQIDVATAVTLFKGGFACNVSKEGFLETYQARAKKIGCPKITKFIYTRLIWFKALTLFAHFSPKP